MPLHEGLGKKLNEGNKMAIQKVKLNQELKDGKIEIEVTINSELMNFKSFQDALKTIRDFNRKHKNDTIIMQVSLIGCELSKKELKYLNG